jgi:hypothetical protein
MVMKLKTPGFLLVSSLMESNNSSKYNAHEFRSGKIAKIESFTRLTSQFDQLFAESINLCSHVSLTPFLKEASSSACPIQLLVLLSGVFECVECSRCLRQPTPFNL